MTPEQTLADKAILITGCSSGIGYCLSKGLKDRGYRVFASARQVEDVARLRNQGLEAVQLDLQDSQSLETAVREVLARTGGKLFALINNGAYGQPGAVEDLARDVLRQQFETNVFGTQELTNRILPVMRQQADGRIVQISSLLGLVCLANRGAYNASKFALEALTDTMRLELRDSGILVTLVEPGPIVSRFRENAFAKFRENIDVEHSAHRPTYQALMARLEGHKGRIPFTLPPEAVLKAVIHALESPRPRLRYRVTVPTTFFEIMRRFLPYRLLDKVLWLSSDRAPRS